MISLSGKKRRRLDDSVLLLVLCAIPLTYIFETTPPIGWVDPAIYTGYFRNFTSLNAIFGPTYFGNRFPATLTGWVFNKLLGSRFLDYVFSYSIFVLSLVSVRLWLAPFAGLRAARLAMILLACNPLFIAAAFEHYVDGPCIALIILTFACLFASLRSGSSNWWAFIAGAALASAIVVHPIAVFVLSLTLPWMLMLVWPIEAPSAYIKIAFRLIAGATAVIGLCMALSYASTGSLNFAGPALHAARNLLNRVYVPFRLPIGEWLPTASRVWWTVALAVLAALRMILVRFHLRDESNFKVRAWICVAFLNLFMGYVLTDALAGQMKLQVRFYFSYLLVLAIPLLAILLDEYLGVDPKWRIAVALGVVASLLAIVANSNNGPLIGPMAIAKGISIAGACIVLAAGAAGMWRLKMRKPSPLAASLLIFVTGVMLAADLDTRHSVRVFGSSPTRGEVWSSLLDAADFVDRQMQKGPIAFWFDREAYNEALRTAGAGTVGNLTTQLVFGRSRTTLNAFDSLNGFYLWDRSRLSDQFPAAPDSTLSAFLRREGSLSFILLSPTSQPGLSTALRTLAELGLIAVPVARKEIRLGPASFSVDILQTRELRKWIDPGRTTPLPFPVAADRIAVLRDYPCKEERQRMAFWLDHSVTISEGARKSGYDWMRGATDLSPQACFATSFELSKALHFDWSALNVAPVPKCGPELGAASALLALKWPDVGAQSAAIGDRDLAVQFDEAGRGQDCIIAAAKVRLRFAGMLGAQVAGRDAEAKIAETFRTRVGRLFACALGSTAKPEN